MAKVNRTSLQAGHKVVALALLVALAVGASTSGGLQAAENKVSPKLGKPLSDAHAAMTAERWDEALTHLHQAQAIEGRTAFDNYQIDELLAFVHVRKSDYKNAAAVFERTLHSGFLTPDRVPERLKLLVQLNYEIKNYPKVIEFGNRLLADINQPDPELRAIVGRAQYLSADYKGAAQTMTRTIEEARAGNKPLDETWLQVLLSSYVEMNDAAGTLSTLESLAVEFPKKKYWEDLFRIWKRQADMDPRLLLNLYRLMFEAGMMQDAEDYVQAGRLALRLGLPGEAVAVLEQGKTRNAFKSEDDVERGRQMLQEAKNAAAVDRKTLAALEKEARASKNGEADVQLGMAYVSYGQYEKAIEAIQRGQSKGGLKHASEAELMLGRAYLELDRKTEAATAFERVAKNTQGDQLSKQLGMIANLWLVYLRQPSVVNT